MNKRKAKKIGAWLNYLVGFSGSGPSMLDDKPKRALGKKEAETVKKFQTAIEQEKARRHQCFRDACMDILGEDPDIDWD